MNKIDRAFLIADAVIIGGIILAALAIFFIAYFVGAFTYGC
jgi:hypothetical protein